MDLTISGFNAFLEEVEGWVYDVRSWHNNFKLKLKVPEFKTKLSEKFKANNKEKQQD